MVADNGVDVCLGRCVASVRAWGGLLLFVEGRWSGNNVGLLHLMGSEMRGCCLRGGVLENQCPYRGHGQLVADNGGNANLLPWLKGAGCWKRCFSGRCQITGCKVWITDIGSWWLTPQHVQGIQGSAQLDSGEVEVGVVSL